MIDIENLRALDAPPPHIAPEWAWLEAVAEYIERRAAQRQATKERRQAPRKVVPNGRILEARRAAYHERIQEARDLRRVIRKAAKGEPIPKRLVPQIERMRALSGASQADRDAATFVPGWRRGR